MAQSEEKWKVPAPIYYNAEQVREVLTWPMAIKALEEAMRAVSISAKVRGFKHTPYVSQPLRSTTLIERDYQKFLFTMPGFVSNYELDERIESLLVAKDEEPTTTISTLACKLVTSFMSNEDQVPPLPNILANILLFNTTTGHLECIMEATQITAWRTAAASIAATKHVYFFRLGLLPGIETIKVAIIGCGAQGESHALGMCATFQVSDIYLWNRTPGRAEKLAELLQVEAPVTRVHIATSVRSAVATATVICVATYSSEPLITADMLEKCDVHINAVGAGQVHYGEVAQDIYDQALVYVDSMVNAKFELVGLESNFVGEVGDCIRKHPDNIRMTKGITLFQSIGMAAEDATVAQAVYDALKSKTAEK